MKNGKAKNSQTISLRTPLYFPEGNGSIRLDILVHKYKILQTYKLTLNVYKKGQLLETYENLNILAVLKELTRWVRDFGTKPEKEKNAKD